MPRHLLAFCLLFCCGTLPAAEPDQVKADEETLKSAHVSLDGPALLDFFRRQTMTAANQEKVGALIKQLGAEEFQEREQASAQLLDFGPVAEEQLRLALKSSDQEVRRRAEDCLEQIAQRTNLSVTAAAMCLLALRQPPRTVEVLLAYSPSVRDEICLDELRQTLGKLAGAPPNRPGGRPAPALLAGLTDPVPIRRSLAAEALCRAGAVDQLPAIRKLLADPDPLVRLRSAVALAYLKERAAIPVLIAALGQMPPEQAWLAEQVLTLLAGDQAPAVPLGQTEPERGKCQAAWAGWWQKEAGKVDLAKLSQAQPMLGYTLLIVFSGGTARLSELGQDCKPRWQFGGLNNGVDARILPGNRVLVSSQGEPRITERNFKGEILWEKPLQEGAVLAQRLPNGNTFIVTMSRLVEMEASGKIVFTWTGARGIRAGYKYRDGTIGVFTGDGKYLRLDSSGKELKRLNLTVVNHNGLGAT